MVTKTCEITINGLAVQIVRKAIKNLHLGVYPPNGRVRVAAPLAVSNDAVRLAVIGKLPWIRRQRAQFAAQPRQSKREMVRGESHYFLGTRYRLRIVASDKPAKVIIRNRSAVEIHIREGADAAERDRVMQRWYRRELRKLIAPMLDQWQPVLGVYVAGWGIRKMKTKWGACNPKSRRIWLNLELAKKPVSCLEYLVVHELVHLIERHHNARFIALVDKFLPDWRQRRQQLNVEPLAHETWSY